MQSDCCLDHRLILESSSAKLINQGLKVWVTSLRFFCSQTEWQTDQNSSKCTWLTDKGELCWAWQGLPFPISHHGPTEVRDARRSGPVGVFLQAGLIFCDRPRPRCHLSLDQPNPAMPRYASLLGQVQQPRRVMDVFDDGEVGVGLSAVGLSGAPTLGLGYQVIVSRRVWAQSNTSCTASPSGNQRKQEL